jgi:hypothetical protein
MKKFLIISTVIILFLSALTYESRFWKSIFSTSGEITEGCAFDLCISDSISEIHKNAKNNHLKYVIENFSNDLIVKNKLHECDLFTDSKFRGGVIRVCYNNGKTVKIIWNYDFFAI